MEHQSVKQQVYETVLDNMFYGVYTPETVLIDRTMAEELGASRSTVRSVLQNLCVEGLLIKDPECGYRIPVLTEEDIRELIEYRVILEVEALKKTIAIIRPDELDELVAYTEESRSLSKDPDMMHHWENNKEFHLLLCKYSHNQFLYRALENNIRFCSLMMSRYFKEQWNGKTMTRVMDHIYIVRAIKGRDVENAVEMLREDITSMWEDVWAAEEMV